MMNNRIQLLPPDIYNKIAAGEVIENPQGVVKELVENSVDAGAKRIVIEVNNGGFDLISITDNGCGINTEDVQFAFVKHATSKVRTMDDVEYLQTLGFRGEALASVAAVSKVKLTTRTRQNDTAVCVNVENGEVVSTQFVSANVGTKIEVRDLFYNTPARKKFLKAPSREGAEITKFVAKFILTNPNLEILYYLDGKLVYHNRAGSIEEAMFSVYGENCLENCIRVSTSWDLINIVGYIGMPNYSKANKTYQTLAVNGRYVVDTKIAAAITQAYKPFLMTRQYPFFLLFLEIPCDRIDVNVHPKKSEIRFVNHDKVASVFYNMVAKALSDHIDMYRGDPFGFNAPSYGDVEPQEDKKPTTIVDIDEYIEKNGIQLMTDHQSLDVIAIESATDFAQERLLRDQKTYRLDQQISVEQARKAIGLPTDDYYGKKKKPVAEEPFVGIIQEVDEDELLYERTRILGVAFKTYIILEIDDKLIFVDQHAAHERILFDQFMENRNRQMQELMFPYVFTASDEESEFVENNLENIKQAGFQVQPFGKNTFRIVAVSDLLLDVQMDKFVNYLLSGIEEFKLDTNELVVEKVAQRACKAAIKAGYVANKFEIIYILKRVLDGSVLLCPHGRPITTTISKSQLEKMFKRKV